MVQAFEAWGCWAFWALGIQSFHMVLKLVSVIYYTCVGF